jgi:uncharacterized protein YggE
MIDYMKAETLLFMVTVVAILVLGAVVALVTVMPAGAKSASSSYITVTASGMAYASPQNATVYVTMNGSGNDSAIATANLSLALSNFNYTVMKYVGGNSSRITTESYTLYKVYNKSAYVATESVSVSLPAIQNVSAMLGELSHLKNTYINGVDAKLSAQQVSQLTGSALSSALNNATSQAQVLAGSAALTVRNITVSKGYPVYPYGSFASSAAPAPGPSPIFYNGRQGVVEEVTVQYSYGG